MIVSLMGNRTGAAHAAPKASPAPVARPAATEALFDANGDGVIENWSVLHGGDSFTTLDPPPPGYEPAPPHPHPANDPVAAAAPHHVQASAPSGRGTPAAIHHAHDAYQRDGIAGAPAGPVAVPGDAHSTPDPTPAPVVAVAQPPVASHLPS